MRLTKGSEVEDEVSPYECGKTKKNYPQYENGPILENFHKDGQRGAE
jgi:hypothetical protein